MVGFIQAVKALNIDKVMSELGKITIAVNAERLTNYMTQVN